MQFFSKSQNFFSTKKISVTEKTLALTATLRTNVVYRPAFNAVRSRFALRRWNV